MNAFLSALWAEALKALRSKVPWLTALGFMLAPFVGGLFMFILKNPERARTMGLITAKAQLVAGAADWPTFLALLAQAVALGGAMLFALVTAWVFGREFSDHTAKSLLAIPTPRQAIVAAKFTIIFIWAVSLGLLIFVTGLVVGAVVGLPGWSAALLWRGTADFAVAALLTLALMSPVALLACTGRGYLSPLGWAILTLILAQIVAVTGWGSWFPWAVPALFSGAAGPRSAQVGFHSYVVVAITFAAGLAGTFAWWQRADQAD
jgi:ABC-2 type transport system permease protein